MDQQANVVLTADVSQYERAIDQANQKTQGYLDTVNNLITGIDRAFKSAGRTMQFGGTGIIAGMTAAGLAAARLDQQMSSLQASMKMLSSGTQEYNKRMGDYTKTVSNLRSEFGQTTREAVALSQQLTKLGQSSAGMRELTAQYTKLAAISNENVYGLVDAMVGLQRSLGTEGVQSTKAMTNALAELSAKSGTSATGILQFSQAISPIAKVSGMTQREIMGVSTAFNKAGQDGYTAANAFTKVLTDINRAIQYGSPELKAYANLLGTSVEEFKNMSAADQVTGFFEAVNKSGNQSIKILERFGLEGVRTSKAIQSIGNAGGLRQSISEAIGAGSQEKTDKAAEAALNGFNDELKKMAENGKMVAEAFGQGVLPVMEKVAQGINAVLSPINALLAGLGKLPGGIATALGIGAVAAGTVLKMTPAMVAGGGVFGAARTLAAGWRTGGDVTDRQLSTRDRMYMSMQQRRQAGLPVRGNWLQWAGYGAGQRLRTATDWAFPGGQDGRPDVRGNWLARRAAGLGRMGGIAGTQLAAGFLRAGLEPLTVRNAADLFNRDKATQFFQSGRARDALGWTGAQTAWTEFKDARQQGKEFKEAAKSAGEAGMASKRQAAALNTATNSQRQYTTATRAVVGESMKLARAMGSAAVGTSYFAARGAWNIGRAGMRQLGGLVPGALGMFGGVPGVAMMGGMYAWSKYSQARDTRDEMMRSEDNNSPIAQYQAAIGEAAKKTKSFADILADQGDSIATTTGKFTATVSKAEKDLAVTNKEYSYEGLRGTSRREAASIAASIYNANPSDKVLQELKGDLLRNFGTSNVGVATTTNILNEARKKGASRLDMRGLFGGAAEAASGWDAFGTFAGEDQMKKALAAGDVIGEIASSQKNAQGVSQVAVIAGNQLMAEYEKQRGGWNAGGKREQLARAYTRGLMGESGTDKDIQAVSNALVATAGLEGPEAQAAFRQYLMQSDSEIGRQYKGYVEGVGKNFKVDSMEMVSVSQYESDWAKSGIDAAVLSRMQGGQGGGTGQFIFGNNAQNSQLSRLMLGAIREEGNVGATTQAMKELADYTTNLTGGFASAMEELDKMKGAVGDSSSALYQMVGAARAIVMQRQQIAMGGMTQVGRTAQIGQNLAAARRFAAQNPNDQSAQEQLVQAENAQLEAQAALEQRLRGLMTSWREFQVQRDRGEASYELGRSRAEEDFSRQRMYAEMDYQRQRRWALEDFNLSRRRQEEDFNHQQEQMARQTAKTMTNIYERMNVQRTWSATNLMQNMQDQQQKLAQQQTDLARLRRAGLSTDAISQMGLNEPGQMQQLARIADDIANDPKMIAQFNRLAKSRIKAGEAIATDRDSDQYREMLYQFRKSRDRAESDFNKSMRRQEIQFRESMDRQAEQFGISMERQRDDYLLQIEYAHEDFNRAQIEISGDLYDLSNQALGILHGSAKTQLEEILDNLGTTRDKIGRVTKGTYSDIEKIFDSLGITVTGQPTRNGYTLTAGTIVLPNGQRINAGMKAQGGEIEGVSSFNQHDNIPIMATAGEYMQPVDTVNYYGKDTMEALRQRKIPKGLLEGFANGGMIYKAMEAWVAKHIPNIQVTSSYRPGAITAVGTMSQHGLGKALDLAPPSMGAFNTIKNAFFRNILELIYSPAGNQNVYKGRNYMPAPVTMRDHWDHIHWAMPAFGPDLAKMGGFYTGSGGQGQVWDGNFQTLANMVKRSKNLMKMDQVLTEAVTPISKAAGNFAIPNGVMLNAAAQLGKISLGDDDYKAIKKLDWKGEGGLFTQPTTVGVGERGPEAVIPLNQRGVNFLHALLQDGATEVKSISTRSGGVPVQGSSNSYYQRVDKSTVISGPITVKAEDPNHFLRVMENEKRMAALKGRRT